jgi:hypothetical protein
MQLAQKMADFVVQSAGGRFCTCKPTSTALVILINMIHNL